MDDRLSQESGQATADLSSVGTLVLHFHLVQFVRAVEFVLVKGGLRSIESGVFFTGSGAIAIGLIERGGAENRPKGSLSLWRPLGSARRSMCVLLRSSGLHSGALKGETCIPAVWWTYHDGRADHLSLWFDRHRHTEWEWRKCVIGGHWGRNARDVRRRRSAVVWLV